MNFRERSLEIAKAAANNRGVQGLGGVALAGTALFTANQVFGFSDNQNNRTARLEPIPTHTPIKLEETFLADIIDAKTPTGTIRINFTPTRTPRPTIVLGEEVTPDREEAQVTATLEPQPEEPTLQPPATETPPTPEPPIRAPQPTAVPTYTSEPQPTALPTATAVPVPPTPTRTPAKESASVCNPDFNGSFDISAGDRPQGWNLNALAEVNGVQSLGNTNGRYEKNGSDGILVLTTEWTGSSIWQGGVITDSLIPFNPAQNYQLVVEAMANYNSNHPDFPLMVGVAILFFDEDKNPVKINDADGWVHNDAGGVLILPNGNTWQRASISSMGPAGSSALNYVPPEATYMVLTVGAILSGAGRYGSPPIPIDTVNVRGIFLTC